MAKKGGGKTVGFTMRTEVRVFEVYERRAAEANLKALNAGQPATFTAQDMMREQLAAVPELSRKGGGEHEKD